MGSRYETWLGFEKCYGINKLSDELEFTKVDDINGVCSNNVLLFAAALTGESGLFSKS